MQSYRLRLLQREGVGEPPLLEPLPPLLQPEARLLQGQAGLFQLQVLHLHDLVEGGNALA